MQSKRFFYTDEEKGFLKLNERKLMTHGQNTTNQKIWNLYIIILLIVCVHCAMCNVHTFAAYSNWSSIWNRS